MSEISEERRKRQLEQEAANAEQIRDVQYKSGTHWEKARSIIDIPRI